MSECRPTETTQENTTHLLFYEDNNELPWIWREGGWSAFAKGKVFTPQRMADLGWQYRRPQ